MRFILLLMLSIMLLMTPIAILAGAAEGEEGFSLLRGVLSVASGTAGALVLGKVKKSVPVPWGPKNNLIPVTNPLLVGFGAWQATGDLKTTAGAVIGTGIGWMFHQIGKRIQRE